MTGSIVLSPGQTVPASRRAQAVLDAVPDIRYGAGDGDLELLERLRATGCL
ncbi:hypothetical protein [Streptomyces sp. NPDC056255]|uniref:hypothetical protein n=1 Tax=Streptomyces sp. NPDC056255 TaxID=3345764 RepID=UPI0035E22316